MQKKLKQFNSAIYAVIIAVIFIAIHPNIVLANKDTNYSQTNAAKKPFKPTVASVSRLVPTTSAELANVFRHEEKEMLILINQERVEAGLPKLELDLNLVKLAREKSKDMAIHNYFGHISKRLGSVYQQLEREKIAYHIAGENLIGAPDFRKATNSVLASPSHRGNILNPHFKKIGIGVFRGGPYGEMITQVFIG